jgi:hypothetical protein
MLRFSILDRSLEGDLTFPTGNFTHLKVFLLVAAILLLLPKSFDAELLWIRSLLVVAIAAWLYRTKFPIVLTERQIIEQHIVDRWTVTEKPFSVRNSKQEIMLDASFKGMIHARYETYFYETRRFGKMVETFYGTNNKLTIEEEQEQKTFYIFIDSTTRQQQFYQLIEQLRQQKIEVKEYTKGVRTYSGKQLKYNEIQALKQNKKCPPSNDSEHSLH